MHKITQGLKKKKKGKKSKRKEEELFKPEELEAYRREHQQTNEFGEDSAAPAENEEWKKFNALTAGIDTILKRTQGDLDRIKSTSFFQRVPTASEVKKKAEEEIVAESQSAGKHEEKKTLSISEAAIVLVSESESEDDDQDDIFDTTYIDVIASGEVKLVHIPDSPKEELEGEDPFDTSIAERAILGPSVDKRGKKLVPIGSAVEILTGRVQAPTCIPIKRPITRRQIGKEKLLLLEKFDENRNNEGKENLSSEVKVTLLDDDAPTELLKTPIDLSQNLHLQLATAITPVNNENEDVNDKLITADGFRGVDENLVENENDEFALLAAESLSKKVVINSIPLSTSATKFEIDKESWSPFGEKKLNKQNQETLEADGSDPFDTTFAENILPGKAELKIIENEILNTVEDSFHFQAKGSLGEHLVQKVTIQIKPSIQQELGVVENADKVSGQKFNLIKPLHKDLLGGSSTDLSKLGDTPLQPSESVEQNYIEYCDPFDTSIVDTVKQPGQTELKFLERELLGELKRSVSDDNFNPREEEPPGKQQNRKVSFDLPLEQSQIILEGINKIAKPLTPYYIRENSIPEIEEIDPFDTSFVSEVAPGKAELKLIENELFVKNLDTTLDSNFNPRDDKQVAVARVVQTIHEITNPDIKSTKSIDLPSFSETVDLLGADNDVQTKVLTPATEKIEFDYLDPFDTSIASNILPGKTELKLLESELINAQGTVPEVYHLLGSLKSKSVEKNLFEEENYDVTTKPLTPILGRLESDTDVTDDIDPFDTTIASNIGLGKTEIKILESELI